MIVLDTAESENFYRCLWNPNVDAIKKRDCFVNDIQNTCQITYGNNCAEVEIPDEYLRRDLLDEARV